MATLSKDTFTFLKTLKKNNNREWFMDNKPTYQKVHQEFIEFIDELIREIAKFDPSISHHSGKAAAFRIYRDVRFSKDKSPYKTHFGAHITAAEKKSEIHSRAGYYIHIGPGESMLAGGAYMPESKWIKSIRDDIAHDPDEFKAIIQNKTFKKYFGELEGEKLKTAPKGFAKDHPEIELLRYKSFLASHQMEDKLVTSADFLKHCASVFKGLKPLDDYLNRSLIS
ncbi:DUF2461 domain-containing protein [bacterium SCSIO 12741]|nr:DUF2461 domain-containing protein [bacterium SCSIO 12741]